MGPLDLLVIGAYLLWVVLSGVFFARRQQSTERYFFAGQNVPWWAIGASIVATETSTISFISVPGIAYVRGGNFTFLQLVLGYLIGRVVVCILFIPSYFRGKLTTVYELLETRFGRGVTALAASLFVVMRTIADAVRLLLTAIVIAAVYVVFNPAASLPLAISMSVVGMGLVMIVFTFFGGMEAVVWIEVVQLGIYIAGAIAAAVVLVNLIPGGLHTAVSLGIAHDKFRVFDFGADLTRTYGFWAGLIGGCFLTMSTHGTDQYMVQRYLSTEGPRPAAMGLLASGVVVFLQFTGFLFLGVLLFAFYRPDQLVAYGNGPAAAPFAAGDQVFADFITHHLPTGIAGLVVAAILAAAMSSSLNSIAATAVADLYRPLVPRKPDAHYLRVSHVLTVLAGAAQIVVALAIQGQTRSALDTALSVASLINGPILGVFLLGSLRRGGPLAALLAMTAGVAVVMTVRFTTPVAWPWYTVIGSLSTLVAGLLVTLLVRENVAD
ncbi:MAG: sodium/solute symporter [Acidobacteriota bacterium]